MEHFQKMMIAKALLKQTNEFFQVDILEKNRKKELVEARVMLAMVLKNRVKMSYKAVGAVLQKDHTTIIHYMRFFANNMLYNKEWREMWFRYENEIFVDHYHKDFTGRKMAAIKQLALEIHTTIAHDPSKIHQQMKRLNELYRSIEDVEFIDKPIMLAI
jgi:chromosomal replication initiation ATPase DnaA